MNTITLSSNNRCWSVTARFSVYNTSFIEVNFRSNCSTQTMMRFGYSLIVFDKTQIYNAGYAHFQHGRYEDFMNS